MIERYSSEKFRSFLSYPEARMTVLAVFTSAAYNKFRKQDNTLLKYLNLYENVGAYIIRLTDAKSI